MNLLKTTGSGFFEERYLQVVFHRTLEKVLRDAADYQKLMEIEEQRGPLDEELLALYEQWEELNG